MSNLKIKTEKIMVANRPCRKILGFSGIPEKKDCPSDYLNTGKYVYIENGVFGYHVFTDRGEMSWRCSCGKTRDSMEMSNRCGLDVGGFLFCGVQVDSVWKEEDFQKIVEFVRQSKERLDTIIRESWSGEEVIEI